ncbi:Uncharacterised protein [uncultured archaeon]|nr:Uncharacterised protein [uncultured archaeon]
MLPFAQLATGVAFPLSRKYQHEPRAASSTAMKLSATVVELYVLLFSGLWIESEGGAMSRPPKTANAKSCLPMGTLYAEMFTL